MSFQSELYYALLLLTSTITSLPVSYYALTQRGKFAGSTTFAITLLAMAVWQVTAALEILSSDPASKLLWGNLQFFAVVSIPVGWLAMTYQYITDGAWVTLRRVAVFSVVPIITLILVFTNDLHGLMFSSVEVGSAGALPFVQRTFGPWFWVHAAYSYGLLIVSGALLVGAMVRSFTLFRGQPLALLAGMMAPLVWNVAYVFSLGPSKTFDMTPMLGSLGAAICWWGLYRYRLFDRPPVAYDKVVEAISDGILAVDSRGLIIDMNPAAEEILATPLPKAVGRQLSEVFGHLPELMQLHEKPDLPYVVLVQGSGESQTYCAVRSAPILGWQGRSFGQVFVLRDFTQRKMAEDAVRERDQRYQELADALPETVFEVDITGRVAFVNKSGRLQFGYTSEEVEQGLNVIQMLSKGDRERAEHDLWDAMRTKQTDGAQEYLAQRKDGSAFPSMVSTNIVVRNGEPVGLRGIVVDVSARKEAERERERLLHELERWAAHLDAVIGAIPVGLVIFDEEGNIVQANAFGREIMTPALSEEVPLRECLAELMMETTDGKRIPIHTSPPIKALRGESVRDEVMVLHLRDGRAVCASVSAAPIKASAGNIVGAVVTFADVTELLDLQKERDDIIRAITHDLRGPLTVILGHGQILDQQLAKSPRERRLRVSSESVVLAARQMNAMINNLLDSIRMEAGRLELNITEVDIPRLLSRMLEQLNGVLDIERIRVDVPHDLPPVSADSARLERILMNLITNALKYSQLESEVVVYFARKGSEVVTSVADQGDGIAPDELPYLFQKYGKTKTSRHDSLGLGLYITKGLVEAHGGRIWVDSREGIGSTFSFSLPVWSERPEPK